MTKRVMGSVRAELLKMKHTFLIPFHVAVPVIIAGFMLFYYRGTIGNPMGQTMAYFELIGIGLPFVVSIVCAGNIGLEEQNHFQVFLGNYKVKGKGFVVKGVVLFGMGVLAIFGAAVLFAAGYHFLLGKEGIGMRYVRLTGTLWRSRWCPPCFSPGLGRADGSFFRLRGVQGAFGTAMIP